MCCVDSCACFYRYEEEVRKEAITNRLSEATEFLYWPQAEAWGLVTITALRAENWVYSINNSKK